MSYNLKWNYIRGELTIDDIRFVENYFKVKFPLDYVNCIIKNNGAYPVPDTFFANGNEETFNNLLSLKENVGIYILEIYINVEDRMTASVVPFGRDPFGNLICFDYRGSGEPTIVFWDHEKAFNNKESAISYVCDSFTDLLEMLHEPKDE